MAAAARPAAALFQHTHQTQMANSDSDGPISVRQAMNAARDAANEERLRRRDQQPSIALVDGSNVAHAGESQAQLGNIRLVCDKLREEGMEPIVVADAALRHHIDEPDDYQEMVHQGQIRSAPAGTDADYFLLSFARELDAAVVSNDRFSDFGDAFLETRDRVIRYMVVAGEVVFERRSRRRE